MVKRSSSATSNASATGPMLPASVESKVEQYLKKYCFVPPRFSHSSASSDSLIASAAGMERDFSATMTASVSGTGPPGRGTPSTTTVDMPSRTSVLARSVAPVKSSAMQPSSMEVLLRN